MNAGTPVINAQGIIGITTKDIDRNGNIGVMLVGENYPVRYSAADLTPVSVAVVSQPVQ